MFKGLRPIFWISLAILYGYALIFMLIEMNIPAAPYTLKIGGAPASFLYGNFFGCLVLNLIVAFLLYWVPEQEEKKAEASKGVTKSAS